MISVSKRCIAQFCRIVSELYGQSIGICLSPIVGIVARRIFGEFESDFCDRMDVVGASPLYGEATTHPNKKG